MISFLFVPLDWWVEFTGIQVQLELCVRLEESWEKHDSKNRIVLELDAA